MSSAEPDHYATLGLDRRCTAAQIRAAYRVLAKQLHPDMNPASPEAHARTQALNAAYAALGDPATRRAYDESLAAAGDRTRRPRQERGQRNLSQEAHLRIEEFLRGATLEIQVRDPAAGESETYSLEIPPGTAPGTRFRIPREGALSGGYVEVRVRPRPDFRFKARGSDLRCDLRIDTRRAAAGGVESVRGPSGNYLRVEIPRGVGRGEVLCLEGEGLPKRNGARGDLLVRIQYRPEVRVRRKGSR